MTADDRPEAPETPGLGDPGTLRRVVESLAEGAYVGRPGGWIVDGNPALVKILGARGLDEVRQLEAEEIWVDLERRHELEREVDERGSVMEFEIRVRRRDGEIRTVLDTCHALHDDDGEPVSYCGVLLDVTDYRNLERELEEMTLRDPLTGCYNRRYLEHQRRALERPSHFWGCLILDLDSFKAVNDRFGHDEGDRVLQRFAHFLIRHKRADDVLVRVGGDEFALLVEVVEPSNMDIIAERLIENGPKQSPIAFSVGHAYRKPGETVEDVLRRADAAMYAAKGRREDRERRNAAEVEVAASDEDG